MNYTIIGEQIQKYRKAAQLTQKELGEALGISSSAVSQWETGGTPDISLLPAIADRLGISINALFGREDITPNNMKEALPLYVASLPETNRLKEIAARLIMESFNGHSVTVNKRKPPLLWKPKPPTFPILSWAWFPWESALSFPWPL